MSSRNNNLPAIVCTVLFAFCNMAAHAHEAGDWLIRAGLHTVDPKSDNGDIVTVADDTMFTFDVVYMLTPNWGLELLAAAPFKHDIALVNGPTVASAQHLPPRSAWCTTFCPTAASSPTSEPA